MTGHAPPVPGELAYALRVSIDGLRPWEYDAMPFWQYEEIRHAQAEWAKCQRALPLRDAKMQRAAPTIDPSGVGPQVIV